jgi:AcrR family transcriptional regulator
VAPRSYRLVRRAESAAATRDRIVQAATALYQERGVNATTLAAIADRADVSRGTILHHFGGVTGVIDAVAAHVLETLDLPDERIFDGATDDESRLRAYVQAIVEFFQRSTGWWAVFMTEMDRPELKAREADYYAEIGRLQAIALGSLASNPTVNVVVGSLVHPGTIGGFLWVMEQAGFSKAEAVDGVTDVVVAYVDRARRGAADGRTGEGRQRT